MSEQRGQSCTYTGQPTGGLIRQTEATQSSEPSHPRQMSGRALQWGLQGGQLELHRPEQGRLAASLAVQRRTLNGPTKVN